MADGNELAAGQEGEVWLRTVRDRPTYRYIGASARRREGGWESLGDVGWLDEDNYLYLGDRLEDMILTGGANVYPAEVEAALQEHPDVRSVAVIGLPDDDLGNIVHAIVEADPGECPRCGPPRLRGDRLARYKVPRSVEYTDQPLRNEAGKIRRNALRAERLDPDAGRFELAQEGANAATNPTKAKRSVPAVIRRKSWRCVACPHPDERAAIVRTARTTAQTTTAPAINPRATS